MKKISFALIPIIVISILLFYSCANTKADCYKLSAAIVDDDKQTVKNEINRMCSSFKPNTSSGDSYGQEKNFQKLVTRISETCDQIKVTDACYACIAAEPPISTFKVSIQVDTITVIRTIEIGMTAYNRLQYRNIVE